MRMLFYNVNIQDVWKGCRCVYMTDLKMADVNLVFIAMCILAIYIQIGTCEDLCIKL